MPVLILELERFDHHRDVMQGLCNKAELSLRPQSKRHESSCAAKLNATAGAAGICVAPLRESAVWVEAGVARLLRASTLACSAPAFPA